MITHDEYMKNSNELHHSYYLEIAEDAGISYVNSPELPRIKAALANGDKHLNTIPLQWWDSWAYGNANRIRPHLKARGTFWTLGSAVCVEKAAAKEAAKSA